MTSEVGTEELDANNWNMYLSDIWAGQGGNECNPLGEASV